jgi:hypothetical protein
MIIILCKNTYFYKNIANIYCENRDEYGFHGEKVIIPLSSFTYFIRISGYQAEFGKGKGLGNININPTSTLPEPPDNQNCLNALEIQYGEPCISSFNYEASHPEVMPSANSRSRADVWFTFIAGDESELLFESRADFSDVITLFKAEDCNSLSEQKSNEQGADIILQNLEAGERYFIQVSGYFSSLEGYLCASISIPEKNEENEDCFHSINIDSALDCISGNNKGMDFSGIYPPCDPLPEADIWFHFVPAENGQYLVKTHADFLASFTMYEGDCSDLRALYCNSDHLRCTDYMNTPVLNAGQKYYIQLASRGRIPGYNQGEFCLEIIPASLEPEWRPVKLIPNAICISKNTALIIPDAEGGNPPYKFFGSGIDAPILSNTEVLLEVEDRNKCIHFLHITTPDCSEVECNLVADYRVQNVSCYAEENGRVDLEIYGGLGPYEVNWSVETTDKLSLDNLSAGAYYVTIEDAAGCTESINIVVSEPEELQITLIEIADSIAGEGSIRLSVSGGTSPYHFFWKKDGVDFEGEDYLVMLDHGKYQVEVHDANACSLLSEEFEIRQISGTYTTDLPDDIRVFPNPATDRITLEFSRGYPELHTLHILNSQGQLLLSQKLNHSAHTQAQIDISHLAQGSYFIELIGSVMKFRTVIVKM